MSQLSKNKSENPKKESGDTPKTQEKSPNIKANEINQQSDSKILEQVLLSKLDNSTSNGGQISNDGQISKNLEKENTKADEKKKRRRPAREVQKIAQKLSKKCVKIWIRKKDLSKIDNKNLNNENIYETKDEYDGFYFGSFKEGVITKRRIAKLSGYSVLCCFHASSLRIPESELIEHSISKCNPKDLLGFKSYMDFIDFSEKII